MQNKITELSAYSACSRIVLKPSGPSPFAFSFVALTTWIMREWLGVCLSLLFSCSSAHCLCSIDNCWQNTLLLRPLRRQWAQQPQERTRGHACPALSVRLWESERLRYCRIIESHRLSIMDVSRRNHLLPPSSLPGHTHGAMGHGSTKAHLPSPNGTVCQPLFGLLY
jgi:hypothetical protein